ncbi:MAG: hypothetical protein KC912_12750 [Proteobacteria bacterium]|nr:hypothetical protein [Pseudomonadota bacterium]
MSRLLPVLLLCVGCSEPSDTRWSAISYLEIAREVDGVSQGFDLDGTSSDEDGSTGCGIGDYESPDGSGGIDNAIARVMPALEATEGAALEPLINQNINMGEVLMIFGVSGIDDPLNDDEVSVTFVRGFGAPLIGASNTLVSGQTFERDTSLEPVSVQTASIVDGVLEAEGASVVFPITVFDANPTLVLENVAVRFEYDERGDFVGTVGGALNYDILLGGLLNTGIGDELEALLPAMFENNADLDSDDGRCSRMSLTIEVDGVNAFLHDPPEGLD